MSESLMPRKFIDLIRTSSSKWVNWDPLVKVKVGSYGEIDKETGNFIVEGNVYDPEFQKEFDKHGVKISMADFPPQEGSVEDDFFSASRGVKRGDVNADKASGVPGIADASIKGEWTFQQNKRGAVFTMHRPRNIRLPPNAVLEPLYKVDKLINKWLVTSIDICPAYAMYLSDKSGDKVSLALVPKESAEGTAEATSEANGGFTWWVDNADSGLFQKACDEKGEYSFTTLYSLMRPIKRIRRFFRDRIEPEPAGDELWYNDSPPWDPLDEDGEEDLFDPSVRAVDPFAAVEKKAAEEAAAAAAAAEAAKSTTADGAANVETVTIEEQTAALQI